MSVISQQMYFFQKLVGSEQQIGCCLVRGYSETFLDSSTPGHLPGDDILREDAG